MRWTTDAGPEISIEILVAIWKAIQEITRKYLEVWVTWRRGKSKSQ